MSLSHARPRSNAASAFDVLQVEPLLHRECAAICIQHCPSLKRDLASGAFEAQVVSQARVQVAIADPKFICEYVPNYVAGDDDPPIAAHAKVQLIKSRRIEVDYLSRH